MGHRPDLNGLTTAQRITLVDLMLGYLTDAVVAAHTTITHSGSHLFSGHRAYIEEMESYLMANGGGAFVPLPKWNPANPVPAEFNVVKPQDDGTPRQPMVNLNPNLPLPSQFLPPAVCEYDSAEQLGNDVNGWHGNVHVTVGGAFGDFPVASSAPLFWCFHAFVDEVYYDWQHCVRLPPIDLHKWAAVIRILFGVTNDGGGLGVTPGGHPVPIDPWGPLFRLDPAKRDVLLGMAVSEMATLAHSADLHRQLRKVGMTAMHASAEQMLRRAERHHAK